MRKKRKRTSGTQSSLRKVSWFRGFFNSRQLHRVTSELETGLNVDDLGLEDWGLMEMQVDIHLDVGSVPQGTILKNIHYFYFYFNKML